MKRVIVWVAVLCMVATSAYASEWKFYGSARVHTMYQKVENQSGSIDNTNFSEALQTNSRIGANVKVNDALTGGFEYGAGNGVANVRRLYGEWNFGGGSLLVGREWTPLNIAYSNQVYGNAALGYDAALDGIGDTTGYVGPMLRLSYGNFQIAAVAPDLTYNTPGASSTQVMIPAIEVYYKIPMNNWNIQMAGGYQTFDVYNAANQTGQSFSVDSYTGAVGVDVTLQAFTLAGIVHAGQNEGNLIDILPIDAGTTFAGYSSFATGTIVDNESYGFNLIATYTANEMFKFETGYGYIKTKYDTSTAAKDDAKSYYLQSVITLAPGVTITPEIGRIDFKQATQDQITYAAVKWQLDF